VATPASTDYGQLLKDAFDRFIKSDNLIPLCLGSLILSLGSFFTIGILAGPLMLGFTNICVKIARGEKASLDDLKLGFQRFGTAFVAAILMGIAMFIGFLLLFVPGIILAFLFSYVFCVMATRPELGAIDTIKESFRLVKANVVDLLVVWAIGMVLTSVLSPTLIGGIAGSAYTMLLISMIYLKAVGTVAVQPPAPENGARSAF